MKRHLPPTGLATRLFVAQALVAAVAAATLWLVAFSIGPAIFHEHLRRAATDVTPTMSHHVEEAFRSASAISIGVALIASVAAALAISAFVSRRIAGPVVDLAAAARDLADGSYNVRVSSPALGSEFTALSASFNTMAARLGDVETTRRRMLADLAHEMRTPIATLIAYLDGLDDGIAILNDATMGVLRTQTTRLSRLAEDISSVSRAEEGQVDLTMRSLSPAALVDIVVATAKEQYTTKGVTLVTDVADDLPAVIGDPDRLAQVFGNLLDNALRHCPPGATVAIRARQAERSNDVEFEVTDTGDGIPNAHLPHIFERFYRVDTARDRTHGGSGIGLSIAKALVEAQGGSITAASRGPGYGSRFTVALPFE